jgi:glycosyltransferase involved in cell wall biosynthesis
MKNKIYVITPVLNEEPNIIRLLQGWKKINSELTNHSFEFILINDGSTDKTVEVAKANQEKLMLTILSHDTNYGPGYAFGTGFEYLADKLKPTDLVITMEGDNTSRIETFSKMVERQIREKDDVVLASPLCLWWGNDKYCLAPNSTQSYRKWNGQRINRNSWNSYNEFFF